MERMYACQESGMVKEHSCTDLWNMDNEALVFLTLRQFKLIDISYNSSFCSKRIASI